MNEAQYERLRELALSIGSAAKVLGVLQALGRRDEVETADFHAATGEFCDELAKFLEPTPLEHGCHCELDPGMKPDGCVLDEGRPEQCLHAKGLVETGKGRDDCSFWRPIEFAHPATSKEAR